MNTSTPPTLARIRPLTERLVNKIAAGEVIERPASVVKELVENALDAQATRVEIVVVDAGMSRIEIHDNGIGIPGEQLEIAFARHATSKISEFDDLESVTTFGFRGEALPSVASVSRLRMVTKTADADHAMEIIREGGVTREVRPSHRANGTSVIVEDLFFNTPVRKKFLKAEATESKAIARIVTDLALSARGVGVTYTANGRTVFSIPPEMSPIERVSVLLGLPLSSLVTIEIERSPYRLEAYLGQPHLARSARGALHFFVNKRALKASPLTYAVSLGYGELLPRGVYPVGVAFFEVDSSLVDVNVHPAKSEVRLSSESAAHEFVRQTVKAALRSEDIIGGFSDSAPTGIAISAGRERVGSQSAILSRTAPAFNRMPLGSSATSTSPTEQLFGVDTTTGEVLEPRAISVSPPAPRFDLGRDLVYLGQFDRLYLLAGEGESLFLIDQHAAHERLLYEQTMATLERASGPSQQLMFPLTVELSAERFALWESCRTELAQVGFEMSDLGGRTVMISATPAILGNRNAEAFFSESLGDIERLQKGGYSALKSVAQMVACRAAVKAGDSLNPDEARSIVLGVLACETGYACPHGRPIFVRLTRAELDRRFGRT